MLPQPHCSGIRLPGTAITSVVVGAAATVAVAWGCAMWSPIQTTVDPFPNPAGIADTVDPDGVVGLFRGEGGMGWEYMVLRGERFTTLGRRNVWWTGPYGGVYHRVAGWPLLALRSRVQVLDSQVSSRGSDGNPPRIAVRQRRRWELPAREIAFRGIATKDLPDWIRAYPDRRLPLVPMALGFAVDTLTYGVAFALLACACRMARPRLRPAQRGFAVITEDVTKPNPAPYPPDIVRYRRLNGRQRRPALELAPALTAPRPSGSPR
jgi:hypothetical protein